MKKGLIVVFFALVLCLSISAVYAATESIPLETIASTTGFSERDLEKLLKLNPEQKAKLLEKKFLISIDIKKIWESEKSWIQFEKKGHISAKICDSSKCTSFFFGNERF